VATVGPLCVSGFREGSVAARRWPNASPRSGVSRRLVTTEATLSALGKKPWTSLYCAESGNRDPTKNGDESRLALLPTERSGELVVAGASAVKVYSPPRL
jgi:hypothetical protein